MDAWVNDQGIRLRGLMEFQAAMSKGTLDGILDKLKARTLKDGKRVFLQSADDGIVYHTIPTAEAVKILRASGIETHQAQSPMTDKLREHMVKCEKAIQSAKPIIGKHHFPDDYRAVTIIGFISILVEHQEASLLLAMHEMFGSAFALGRPIVEGMYRALWLNVCATDEELKRFNEKDEIKLTLAEMAEAIDPAHNAGDFFQDLKKRSWKALNSYTHTGMLQLGRRFKGHEVVNSYSEGEIYEMTTVATTCVLVVISRFLAKQGHAGDAKAIDFLVETYGPVETMKAQEKTMMSLAGKTERDMSRGMILDDLARAEYAEGVYNQVPDDFNSGQ